MSSISETADRAADILETQGHIKNDWGVDGGPRCLGGAISQAVNELTMTLEENSNLYSITTNAVDYTLGFRTCDDFLDWNNAPERKAEEVIQVLRDVATKHRSDAMTVEAKK